MCYDRIGPCAQNIDTILGLIVNIIGEGLCDRFKRNKNCTFTSYNFCISAPILEPVTTICVILNC